MPESCRTFEAYWNRSEATLIQLRLIAAASLLTGASVVALAQPLPAPSRSVYKCSVNGSSSYSDAPCLGAERLEIEPTRGVGMRSGPDVQHERQREMFAEAIRPLTGLNARQLDVQGRRMTLPRDAQRECRALDVHIPDAERAEMRATGAQRDLMKVRLFRLRQRQRDLRC